MKKIAIGCGVLLILLIGMLVALGIPMFRATKDVIQAEMARAAWVGDWVAPEGGVEAEELFPKVVGGLELVSVDEDAAISEFGIDLAGVHGVYQSTSGTVGVYVYQADMSEKEDIFEQVGDAPSGSGISMMTTLPYRCYRKRSGIGQDHLYWAKGWLFIFRSEDEEDHEPFVKAYFEATSAVSDEGVSVASVISAGSHFTSKVFLSEEGFSQSRVKLIRYESEFLVCVLGNRVTFENI